MRHVVFVAPYFGANIVFCLRALAGLADVKLGVVTHEPAERIPASVRDRVQGHYKISNTLDPEQLLGATRAFVKEWGKVDVLLGFMEEMQLPIAQVREKLGIPGMSAEVARNFRDKNRMKELIGKAGLPVARQARVTSADDARQLVAQVGFPIVLKPLAGVGTKDTVRVSTEDELYAALNRMMPSPDRPLQAEEFVVGDEYTFESVTIAGQPAWHSSTYYLPGPLKVVENAWMQYCVLLPREPLEPHAQKFLPLNTRALAALGMQTGLSHMEWFLTKDGRAVVSEVAARPPGVNIMAMMGIAHGVDMWEKWARLMVYGSFEVPPRSWACGSAFFRGHGGGQVVTKVEGFKEVLADLGDKVVSAQLPQVGQPRSSHYEGEGWAIVRGKDNQTVVDALRALLTRTTVTYGSR